MATAKHAPAKKAATHSTSSGPADPKHPDVHPDRHAGSGMQELPTGGGAGPGEADRDAGAGTHQAEFAPNPSIGVNYDTGVQGAGTAVVDAEALADQDHVYSLEQALSLPVLEEGEKGTPVTAPKAGSKAAKDLGDKVPVLAFKDGERRTLQVVKTKDGLAAQVVA